MFTGIVTELGRVITVEPTATGQRMVVDAPKSSTGMQVGDSVAVNGVCLTAVDLDAGTITFDVVQESLHRSNLGELTAGGAVDLERPMPATGRFDGHVVQGHVDGVGTVESIEPEGEASRIRIATPSALAPYLVEKGSITVDGVSLTITAVSPPGAADSWFEVVLIPHTLEVTVLGRRTLGSAVNLEVDVIAKYVERMMRDRT